MAIQNRRHDPAQARLVWPPSPGTFRLRLVKGGWAVPAQIVETAAGWCAIIDEFAFAPHPDPTQAEGVERIWTGGTKIDQAEYDWLIALKAAAKAAAPRHPAVNPHKRIDHMLLTPIIPRTQN
jgi:hypothetical protein